MGSRPGQWSLFHNLSIYKMLEEVIGSRPVLWRCADPPDGWRFAGQAEGF